MFKQRLRQARENRAAAVRAAVAAAARGHAEPGSPGSPLGAPPLLAPPTTTTMNATNQTLQQALLIMENNDRPTNTARAMDPKKEEWMQYCDWVYPEDPYRHIVMHEKLYDFMCYQSFRE
jgi:hypothetical protein